MSSTASNPDPVTDGPASGPERITTGGARLDLLDRTRLLRIVQERLGAPHRPPLVVASSNLDHLTHFGEGAPNPDPASSSPDADWLVTADGMPLVGAARVMTSRSWPQLAGSDLLPHVLAVAERDGATVGFFGGWPEQHERLRFALAEEFPELHLRGYWSPSPVELRSPERAAELARQVSAAGVDLLVVGLGKPQQELWLREHATSTGARVALAFGAAADFLAGTVDRAPEGWRRFGMEWLYRLLREPRRLWRRYLVEGPAALYRLLRWSSAERT
jgi:N-acetylglucosaminyldiphosphoundecaprenol N-acetyl-beta-D-mannosaminyltransferase